MPKASFSNSSAWEGSAPLFLPNGHVNPSSSQDMSSSASSTSAFSLATATSLAAPLSLTGHAYVQSNIAIGAISGGIFLLFVYATLRTYARHYSVTGQRIRRCCRFLPGIVPKMSDVEQAPTGTAILRKSTSLAVAPSTGPVSMIPMASSHVTKHPVNAYRDRIEDLRGARRKDQAAKANLREGYKNRQADTVRQVTFRTPQGSAFISPAGHSSMYLDIPAQTASRTHRPGSRQSFASLASASSYNPTPDNGPTKPKRAQLANKIQNRSLALQALNGSANAR